MALKITFLSAEKNVVKKLFSNSMAPIKKKSNYYSIILSAIIVSNFTKEKGKKGKSQNEILLQSKTTNKN